MRFIKTYESLTSKDALTVYHNSSSPINKIVNRPIWAALDMRDAMCYYKNMINEIGESYLYEIKIEGNFFNDDLEIFLHEGGIDYYEFLADLTANPSSEEILQLEGVKLLINKGYDGLIHEDYDPCDNSKDTNVILIFDPLSTHISINPINISK